MVMGLALYFAYGSNLSRAQMLARCPGATASGTAMLTGFRLAFAGHSEGWGGAVATVWPESAASVPGRLYHLTDADWKALDRIEGCPHRYQREVAMVTDGEGAQRRAHLYVKHDLVPATPTAAYVDVIRKGYLGLGFDIKGLERALAEAGADIKKG